MIIITHPYLRSHIEFLLCFFFVVICRNDILRGLLNASAWRNTQLPCIYITHASIANINQSFVFFSRKKKHHHTRYAHESTVTYSNIRMKLLTHTNCWFVLVCFFYSFQTNIKTPEQFGKYAGYSWKEQKLFWKYVMSILYQIVCVCCMWRKYQWPTAKRSLTKYYFRVHLFDRLFFITEMQFVCVYNWSIMVFINQWIDSVVVVESYTWLCSWKIPTQQQFCLFFFLLSVSLEE